MLKKIAVREVQLGMYLHELSGTSWINQPFWKTKFVIREKVDLQRLISSDITEVWIDTALGTDVVPVPTTPVVHAESVRQTATDNPPPSASVAAATRPLRLTIEEEVKHASLVKQRAKLEIGALFHEARMGNAINTGHLSSLVEDISASVMRNPGVFVSLARLKSKDDYTYLHSVAVCALMVSLGRQLGLDEETLRNAGMAGLLHDLGKAKIPLDILNKPGKLTEAEFALVKRHPRDGYEMLSAETSSGALAARDVALHHHERMDGRGYPDRLAGENISLLARMSAVCDVYDAITSNRPYKTGWDPAESVHRMATWTKEGHFDMRIFQAFVKSIGIYPTGSLVRLQSGRLAVVLDQCETSALKPRVKAFFSINANMQIPPVIIDLADPHTIEKIVGRESCWQEPDRHAFALINAVHCDESVTET